jgi:hypothetical protein
MTRLLVARRTRRRDLDDADEEGSRGSTATHPLLDLQRQVGNAAVTRLVARREAPEAGGARARPARPDWSTQAKAEATAKATRARLYNELIPFMVAHKNPVIRNTAEFFTGAKPLLTMEPITQRSDSAALLAAPDLPGWVDPTLYEAFFTGTTMDNVDYHQSDMIGTLDDDVMYVRGHDSSGATSSLEEMAGIVVHEVSHFMVKRYGDLPNSTNASSYDRYADEFRAYWVEPGRAWSNLSPKDKAAAIRRHLVGTADDPASGYPKLHKRYYGAGNAAFKAQVDALQGPVGFNLSNSKRLDDLWLMLQEAMPSKSDVDHMVLAIDALPTAERSEAATANAISTLVAKLPDAAAKRVRAALAAPVVREYTGALNPGRSGPLAAFYAAVVVGKDDEVRAAYAALTAADRDTVAMNAAFLAYVDAHVTDPRARACLYAMTATRDAGQFRAMAAFLDALGRARRVGATAEAGTIPPDVARALDALRDEARWSFLSWSRLAVAAFVDTLPPKLARAIVERLRA